MRDASATLVIMTSEPLAAAAACVPCTPLVTDQVTPLTAVIAKISVPIRTAKPGAGKPAALATVMELSVGCMSAARVVRGSGLTLSAQQLDDQVDIRQLRIGVRAVQQQVPYVRAPAV